MTCDKMTLLQCSRELSDIQELKTTVNYLNHLPRYLIALFPTLRSWKTPLPCETVHYESNLTSF